MIFNILVALVIFFYVLPIGFKFCAAFVEIFKLPGLIFLMVCSVALWMFFG